MDSRQLLQFLPTMEMICEAFEPKGLDCRFVISDKNLHYRGVRVYHPGQSVQRDLIYLLNRPEADFPVDTCAYASAWDIPGKANHLCCPDLTGEDLLNFLLEFFSQCQQIQYRVDQVVFHNLGVQSLCDLGEELLENPLAMYDRVREIRKERSRLASALSCPL